MMIVKVEPYEGHHTFQSQSHRTEVWEEGYLAVPEQLEQALIDCRGYCELIVADGELTGINPEPPPAYNGPPIYSELEVVHQNITDLELENIEQGQQLTDLELMVLEGKV